MAHSHNAVDTKLVAMLVFLKFFYDLRSQGVNDKLLLWFCKRIQSWINIYTPNARHVLLPPSYFQAHTGLIELLKLGAVVKFGGEYKITQWATDCVKHDWPWARPFLTPGVLQFMEMGIDDGPRWETAQIPEAPQFLEHAQDPVSPR